VAKVKRFRIFISGAEKATSIQFMLALITEETCCISRQHKMFSLTEQIMADNFKAGGEFFGHENRG